MEKLYRQSLLELLPAQDFDLPDSPTSMMKMIHQTLRKPLEEYTNEDLRVLIGQEIALEYLVPIAINHLAENPFIKAGSYFGDLLSSVVRVNPSFWNAFPEYYWMILEIVSGASPVIEKLSVEFGELIKLKDRI
jgi:hypothetical protein